MSKDIDQKKLITKLIKSANELKDKPKGSYISLSEEYIKKYVKKWNVSFEEAVNIFKNTAEGKDNEK